MASWFNEGVKRLTYKPGEKDEDDEEDHDEQVEDLKAKVKSLEMEIQMWRGMHTQEVEFMRNIIIKLIDKPTGPVSSLLNRPLSARSPKDERKIERGIEDNRNKHVDMKAGPAKKLL